MELVRLTDFELLQAALVGAERNIKSKFRGYDDAHGYSGDGWEIHINGACAEIAVAKKLGLFWNGNEFKEGGDVGGYEVRSTPRADGRLILHDSDPSDRIFILVRGGPIRWEIVGWIPASEGKQKQFKMTGQNGHRPAYFIPDTFLKPLSELNVKEIRTKQTIEPYDGIRW